MLSFNQIMLTGYLGNDPQIFQTVTKRNLISFSLSTKYPITKNNTIEYVTEWHSIYAFNKVGEYVAKYLKKGMAVSIVGELHYYNGKTTKKIPYVKLLKILLSNGNIYKEDIEQHAENVDELENFNFDELDIETISFSTK